MVQRVHTNGRPEAEGLVVAALLLTKAEHQARLLLRVNKNKQTRHGLEILLDMIAQANVRVTDAATKELEDGRARTR